jgi:hypothetical protein
MKSSNSTQPHQGKRLKIYPDAIISLFCPYMLMDDVRNPQKSLGKLSDDVQNPQKSLGKVSDDVRNLQKSLGKLMDDVQNPQKSIGEVSDDVRNLRNLQNGPGNLSTVVYFVRLPSSFLCVCV